MAAVTLYPSVLSRIAAAHPKTKSKLPEMERAYESLRSTSSPKPLSLTDLETVLNWKLVRGTFRPSLMSLIRCNSNDSVIEVTKEALILLKNGNDINTWTLALKELIRLRGVGPATASAILALWTPTVPFYSDEAAHIALGLQKLKYTEKEVMMYVDRMRDCAGQLGVSARDLEVALFVNAHKSLLEDEEAV